MSFQPRLVRASDYDEPLRSMIERREIQPPDELVIEDDPRYGALEGAERAEAVRESNQRASGDPYGG